MAFDPNQSKIVVQAISEVVNSYRSDYDHIAAAEAHYERMRTLNKTTLLQVELKKSLGNILGSLSIDSIWNSPGQQAISAALAEARRTILARGVGPLEELPVQDYVQDDIRAKNVITHTQIGPEQKLIAKLVQMSGNKWNTINSYGGPISEFLGDFTVLDQRTLKKNLTANKEGQVRTIPPTSRGLILPDGDTIPETADDPSKSKWLPAKFGTPYGREQAEEIVSDRFQFKIKNLASGIVEAFPAHISVLNEAVSPSWSNISLINRSEDIYIYQRAERSLNFEFYIFASSNVPIAEVDEEYNDYGFPSVLRIDNTDVGVMDKVMMWRKINFLHTLTRPSYTQDGKYDKSPYCEFTMGDLYKRQTIFFDSLNINYDPLLWDMNVDTNKLDVRPMIAQITLSGKFIHSTVPSVNTQFYGEAL